jgi:signal peptidase I
MRRLVYRAIFIIITAVFLRACVFEVVRVGDNAAAPTIVAGDLVLINKLAYGLRIAGAGDYLLKWRDPLPGDLVFTVEWGDPPISAIRRVALLPGEVIKVQGQEARRLTDGEYGLGVLQDDGFLIFSHGSARVRNVAGRARYILLPRQKQVESIWNRWIQNI